MTIYFFASCSKTIFFQFSNVFFVACTELPFAFTHILLNFIKHLKKKCINLGYIFLYLFAMVMAEL